MPAKITFKVPTKTGTIDKTGYVANFKVGDKTIKFVMQDDLLETPCLTHYASGMIAIHSNSVASLKLSHYMHNPYATPITNRKACETLLNELINQHGAEKILAKFDAANVINN